MLINKKPHIIIVPKTKIFLVLGILSTVIFCITHIILFYLFISSNETTTILSKAFSRIDSLLRVLILVLSLPILVFQIWIIYVNRFNRKMVLLRLIVFPGIWYTFYLFWLSFISLNREKN